MDDATTFTRLFGDRQGRSASGGRLVIRDAAFVADLKALASGLAARSGGWRIDFSPTRTDDLTERSLFDATLTSTAGDERRLRVALGREWVEIDGGLESAVRTVPGNVARAMENAFRRVLPRGAGIADA